MSEVTSVNGKTGEVILKAADVEAIPTAQAGAANGVATLDSGTKLTGAQIPSSVASRAEVSTEKERAEAAEALKIPLSQKGSKSGVAELNEESKLPEAQLPGAVVSGSPTGGVAAWKAKTKYAVNQLAQASEVTYICLEAHESGETFSGVGTHWAQIAGNAVEVSAPAPTGIAATDTANLQAALNAAAGGVCKITKPGTYAINAMLVRPYNASVFLGPNCILQAAASIAGPVLSDSKTERSLRQCIVGGGVIDSNNKAQNALWCRYFQRGMTLGVVCKNSTQSDCILGDTEATAKSDEAFFTAQFACDRTGFSVPVGAYSLWLQNCSDTVVPEITLTGQERGLRLDSSNIKCYGTHPLGAAYPMNTMCENNSIGSEFYGCQWDTPTSIEHKAATAANGSNVVTDAAILSQHVGLPVSGANIPDKTFVLAVTPGVSFTLGSASGAEMKTTGEVKGVTLAGVGLLNIAAYSQTVGGGVYVNPTYGVDNACYGIVFAPAANTGNVAGFYANGGSESFRVSQALAGNLFALTWSGLLQRYCVNYQVSQVQLASQHGTTLNLSNNAGGAYLTAKNSSGTVLAEINNAGQIVEHASPCTPGLLAYAHYAPSSSENYTTESTTLVAIDSTNLTVSFVAPPSGKVLVRLEGHITNETGGDKVVWALVKHGETTQVGDAGIASDSNNAGIRPLTILVSGLVAGETYQYDWAWAVSAGKAKQLAQAVKTPWTNAASPATMEVWAA